LPDEPPGLARPDGLRARWVKPAEAPEVVFVALGSLVPVALEAAADEPRWAVLDARAVSPLDEEALLVLVRAGAALVTAEEGSERGGLGGAVLECLANHGVPARVRVLGLPGERFIRHGEARQQRAELGLDAEGLRRAAREVLGKR
jgi:1-deoxy-D-xylulose-5-phosphate synthase